MLYVVRVHLCVHVCDVCDECVCVMLVHVCVCVCVCVCVWMLAHVRYTFKQQCEFLTYWVGLFEWRCITAPPPAPTCMSVCGEVRGSMEGKDPFWGEENMDPFWGEGKVDPFWGEGKVDPF